MEELLKKILESAEHPEAVDLSEEGVRKAAKELDYSDDQIAELFTDFDGFPLDEETLNTVIGGAANTSGVKHKYTY